MKLIDNLRMKKTKANYTMTKEDFDNNMNFFVDNNYLPRNAIIATMYSGDEMKKKFPHHKDGHLQSKAINKKKLLEFIKKNNIDANVEDFPKYVGDIYTTPNEATLFHEAGHAINFLNNPKMTKIRKNISIPLTLASYIIPAAGAIAGKVTSNKALPIISSIVGSGVGAINPSLALAEELKANKNALEMMTKKLGSKRKAEEYLDKIGLKDGLTSYKLNLLQGIINPITTGLISNSIIKQAEFREDHFVPRKSKKKNDKLIKFQPIKISPEKIKKENKVRQAALQNFTVSIKYKDKKGNVTTREIEPYKIENNAIWGFDVAKGEIRRFNLPGLKSAKPTKNKYNPRWPIEVGNERIAMEKIASAWKERLGNLSSESVNKLRKMNLLNYKKELNGLEKGTNNIINKIT